MTLQSGGCDSWPEGRGRAAPNGSGTEKATSVIFRNQECPFIALEELLVSCLEGGYNLVALAESVQIHLEELLGEKGDTEGGK